VLLRLARGRRAEKQKGTRKGKGLGKEKESPDRRAKRQGREGSDLLFILRETLIIVGRWAAGGGGVKETKKVPKSSEGGGSRRSPFEKGCSREG